MIDEASGRSERFVLIAPCRTEWVYAAERLFQVPSREYRNIYSATEQRSMGRGITYQGERTRGAPLGEAFPSLVINVRRFDQTQALETPEAICASTVANAPLVGRTELADPRRGERYVLEYPIKTMNHRPEVGTFQVDTGPLLAPDADSEEPRPIDRLELAHIAYNRLDRAELILRRPTPIIGAGGRELCQVLHYSDVREYPARTVLLAGPGV